MKWDLLPNDVINLIWFYRRKIMCIIPACIKIQSKWRNYRCRVLIGRYKMLKYIKEFKIWNPNIYEFIRRSRL